MIEKELEKYLNSGKDAKLGKVNVLIVKNGQVVKSGDWFDVKMSQEFIDYRIDSNAEELPDLSLNPGISSFSKTSMASRQSEKSKRASHRQSMAEEASARDVIGKK